MLITRTGVCAMEELPWKGRYKSPLFPTNPTDDIIPTLLQQPLLIKFNSKPTYLFNYFSVTMPQHRPETPQTEAPEAPLPNEPDTSEGDGTADYWGAVQKAKPWWRQSRSEIARTRVSPETRTSERLWNSDSENIIAETGETRMNRHARIWCMEETFRSFSSSSGRFRLLLCYSPLFRVAQHQLAAGATFIEWTRNEIERAM